jgi:hypothetical protein
MDKKLFDDAIGEVPPSTVDVEAAIARGHRAAWTRRVTSPVAAVAAAVVLVTGGIALAILPGDSAPGTTPVAQAPTTDTTSLGAGGLPDGIEPYDCTDEDPATTARLTAAATAAALARLPEGTKLEEQPPDTCFGHGLSWRVNDTQHLAVHVYDRDVPASEWHCQSALECEELSGPNGEVILTTENYPTGGYGVSVIKTTGSTDVDVTEVGVHTWAEEDQGPPLLSRDQLIEIGLEAGLTMDP